MRFYEFGKVKQIQMEEDIPEEFTDINGVTNFLDYILVLEAEATGKPLSENIDPRFVKHLEKLTSLGAKSPEVGKEYIPAFVFYISDSRVRIHGSKSPLELKDIKDEDGLTVYDFGQGKKYPNKRLTAASYGQLFLFDNQTNFDKFMNVMSLKFNEGRLSESKSSLTEAKVGREYQHLEDLVFVDGSAGAIKAANILDELGKDASDVAIKFDGAPTVYWGRDEDGEFVMVGKNGWGKRKSTSPEDLADFIKNTGKGEEWRQDFANEMATMFSILERATPEDFRGFVYGDVLYHPGKPFERTQEGVEFTPNLVKYTVSGASELGKRIANSRVGIVVHTKFNEFGGKSGKPITDVKELNGDDVVVLGQTYVTHQPEVDTSGVDKIRQDAQKYADIIDGFLETRKGLSDMKNIIYTYVNQMSRTRNLNNLETGFFDWLKNSKVSANKQKKIAELAQESPKALPVIFRLVKEIMAVKDYVIDQLDNADSDVKASTGDQRGGEGFVAQKSKTKLVPRTRWQPN